MKANTDRKWFWRIIDFINPLRDPSLTVAAVLTFIEEAGQHDVWYIIILVALINWVAVRGVVWLVVNFTFASTFITRRVWWAIKHPRLAWRILDAVGHEEIIIGGMAGLAEGMLLPEGSTIMNMSPFMTASGFQVIGELPAGTEIPMLNMPTGQLPANGSGPLTGQPTIAFPQLNNAGYPGQQTTDGFPQSFPQAFPQRPSEEEERLRQQMQTLTRLLDDWMQYTEEKWRTVSDSQLGWKPLRGRWGSWDDIFQDAYAAKTSDPMAQAAQVAGEATVRRFDFSKEKGSAASAVACFLRDMMTLRQGMEMTQSTSRTSSEIPSVQPVMPPPTPSRENSSGPLGNTGGFGPRNSLIRRPAPVFVDADTNR